VVADSTWQAKQAIDAMPIVWDAGPHHGLDSDAIAAQFKRDLEGGKATGYHSSGTVSPDFSQYSKKVEALYTAPFLAHATMEPQNATAWIKPGGVCEVWAPTQAPSLVPWIVSRALQLDSRKVTIHSTFLGGGFGRRGELDLIVQAALVAQAVAQSSLGSRPVQVLWSREEDMTHDMYRPAAMAQLKAGIDSEGKVAAYWYRGVSGSVMHSMTERIGFRPMGPDKTNAEGQADKVYEFANAKYEHVLSKTAVPLGFWRSVGHSQNAFFGECFMDELAEAAGKDPLAFRQQYLAQHRRHLAVLNLAAEKAGWGKPLEAGRARGLALHESFGSIVAQVAEVSIVEKGGKKMPKVHKVTCAIDCGTPIHPGIIRAQMESGIVFGLSAALFGEITIARGAVVQTNFPAYDMLRLADSPVVATHIVPSNAKPGGVGEPGTPPIAPAVANALYGLTKKRLRSLPLVLA
jgi:isoquinoline 1-oxidoreductase subunit beta